MTQKVEIGVLNQNSDINSHNYDIKSLNNDIQNQNWLKKSVIKSKGRH